LGVALTQENCPPGLPLSSFTNNTAHSNGRFGLRVGKLASLTYPCKPARTNTLDPFASNPSVESVLDHFTTFANRESGVLGELLGNVKFSNFKVADNKNAGFDCYLANVTKEGPVLDNWLIVG
jgi:hypothetical protein